MDNFDYPNQYLSEISERDKPWDKHKDCSRTVSKNFAAVGYDRYAERIFDCANRLTFAIVTDESGNSILQLYQTRFCRVRQCPLCQWRRSLMWRARFFKHLPRILNDYPTARFLFLTLTIKNCSITELKQALDLMNKAWRRLIELKVFPAIGFVKSVEVTKSQDGSAHPHFHCLLMVNSNFFTKNYINQATWTELWRKCLRVDYKPMVHISSIKKPKIQDTNELHSSMIKAICETLKYSVKESDLISDKLWLMELTKQLHKTRAISLGGIFKEYMSEEEPEDLIHEGHEENIELLKEEVKLIFDWANEVRKYAQRGGVIELSVDSL